MGTIGMSLYCTAIDSVIMHDDRASAVLFVDTAYVHPHL
jgi:hypothetical protein